MGGPIVSGFTPGSGGGGVVPALYCNAAYYRDNYLLFFDDFVHFDDLNKPYKWRNENGVSASQKLGGVVTIGVANDTSYIDGNNYSFSNGNVGDILEVEFRIDLSDNPGTDLFIGLVRLTDRIGFRLTAAGNWFIWSDVGGANQVNQDTGTPPTPGTYVRLKIITTPADAKFYINDVLEHTIINPGVDYTICELWRAILEITNAAVVQFIYCDWVNIINCLATARDP